MVFLFQKRNKQYNLIYEKGGAKKYFLFFVALNSKLNKNSFCQILKIKIIKFAIKNKSMLSKRCFTLLLFLISVHLMAQRGNYKFNNYGNSSILLSGNVTGSVDDIALTYYNPARLTELGNTKFSFNAQAYEFSALKLNHLAGDQTTASDNNFNGIPSIAGGTFNLFGTRFAYSVLSKSKIDININYSSNFYNNEGSDVITNDSEAITKAKFNTRIKDEWVGLTWAKKINEQLSLGISGFASIYKDRGNTTVNIANQNSDGSVAFYNNDNGYSLESYGFFFKIGANYQLPKFDIGLNINLPYLEVYQKGKYNYSKIVAGVASEKDLLFDYIFRDLETDRKEPFGISVGAGIPFGKSKVHLNVDYIAALQSYNRISIPSFDVGDDEPISVLFEEKRRGIVNFGAGIEMYINDKFSSFVSFSTDYNAVENSGSFFDLSDNGEVNNDFNENFTHLGAGIDWNLKWGSVAFGATYTTGSSKLDRSLNTYSETTNNNLANVKYNRWQFIVGLEIPFLNNKINDVINMGK